MKRPVSDQFTEHEGALDTAELLINAPQLLLDSMWGAYGPILQQREQENQRYLGSQSHDVTDDDMHGTILGATYGTTS